MKRGNLVEPVLREIDSTIGAKSVPALANIYLDAALAEACEVGFGDHLPGCCRSRYDP